MYLSSLYYNHRTAGKTIYLASVYAHNDSLVDCEVNFMPDKGVHLYNCDTHENSNYSAHVYVNQLSSNLGKSIWIL